MTLYDFLLHDVIIESENDYLLDASIRDEEEMKSWIEQFVYPFLDEDEITWMHKYEFEDDELQSILEDEDFYWAAIIIKAALISNRRPRPKEDYYINDNGATHVVVPMNLF